MASASAGGFDVRWTTEDDLPILREFLDRHYPSSHPLRDEKYFDFWFRREGEPIGVIIAVVGAGIAGIQGVIRNSVSWRGVAYPAAWYCNTFVAPEHRKRGIGLRLLSFSVRHCDNLLTLAYTPESGALLERLGFSFYDRTELRRYWRLLDRDAYMRLPNRGDLPPTSPRARRAPAGAGPTAVRFEQPDARLAHAWARHEPGYGLTTTRSQDWLRTRYFAHPVYDYHVLSADGVNGFCVARFERAGAESVCRIVDWWGGSAAIGQTFDAAAEYAAARGACFVDFYATSPAVTRHLDAAGFSALEGASAWDVPYLFNPPERRERYSEGFAARLGAIPGGGPRSAHELYFVKADGDRDR